MLPESAILERARDRLQRQLDLPVSARANVPGKSRIDAEFTIGDTTFTVEIKRDARASSVAGAIAQLKAYRSKQPRARLMLVVPTMGEAGAEFARRERVNWVDLNGNADVHEDGLHIVVRGMRDTDARDEHSSSGLNPFSQKASRLVEALLSNPKRPWTRGELHAITGLDQGFVSKIVTALLDERYVIEEPALGRLRNIRVERPMVLLDAWAERYRPIPPTSWSLVAARDGFSAAETIAKALAHHKIPYALTGLPAAAAYASFGSFRRVDIYVADATRLGKVNEFTLDSESRGRNIFFRIDDLATHLGTQKRNSLTYASPGLTYLDLAALPERASEARDEMRTYLEHLWT